jgi:hypothetical protein
MLSFKGLEMAPDFTVKSERQFRKAQDYVDNEVIKRLEDYTPVSMDSGYSRRYKKVIPFTGKGKMSKAHKVETPGVVINTEPTARKEYYTNKGYSGQGKFWLERMKADHKADILKGLKK